MRTVVNYVLIILFISLISFVVACGTPLVPPSSPSNLAAASISQHEVELRWADNSNNEHGFKIYRNNAFVAEVGKDRNAYRDTGLEPATTYRYSVVAYNSAGESEAAYCTVTTRNPGIVVTLMEIGVYFDHDPDIKGRGEIYLGIVVTDGIKTEKWEIPSQTKGVPHYSLNDNESTSVQTRIFSTDEVGDYLRVFIVAYESDGGSFEMLFYEALGIAAGAWMGAETSSLTSLFGLSLGEVIGSLFGAEDDFVGCYEGVWHKNSYWGVGNYMDRSAEDLRVWFTIKEA